MRRITIQVAALTIAALAVPQAAAGDKEILRELAERLEQERTAGNLSAFDICFRASDGRVTLTGYVRSLHEYELTETIAAETDGVMAVANRLGVRIQDPPRPTRAKHTGVPSPRDEVQSTSAAESPGQTSWFKLGWLLDRLPSRSRSKTEAQVVETPPADVEPEDDSMSLVREDREIARDATELLKEQQQAGKLSGFDINLNVKKGVLILTGYVSSKQQRDLAAIVVSRVPGVKLVENRLTIIDGPHMQLVPPPESKPKVVEPEPLD
jgi:osmotically-inducible protein OsmY